MPLNYSEMRKVYRKRKELLRTPTTRQCTLCESEYESYLANATRRICPTCAHRERKKVTGKYRDEENKNRER